MPKKPGKGSRKPVATAIRTSSRAFGRELERKIARDKEVLAQLPHGSRLVGYWLSVAWEFPDGTVVQSRSPVFEILVEDTRG